MELDQLIFQRILRYFKKRRDHDPALDARKVSLEEIKPRLTILSRALTGLPIDLVTAEEEGGWKNEQFYLPVTFSLLPTWEQNLEFYLYRICYLKIQMDLQLNWKEGEEEDIKVSQQKAKECSEEVLKVLAVEFPVALHLHDNFVKLFEVAQEASQDEEPIDYDKWLYGKWMIHTDSKTKIKDQGVSEEVFSKNSLDITTEIKAKAVEEIQHLEVDQKSQEDYTMTHNFEKVETAEEFSGVWRDFDGDDSLEDDQEALDEINMNAVVRVDDMVHSVYQAEFADNVTIAESSDAEAKGHFLSYDEWNIHEKAYRKEYCKVYPKLIAPSYSSYYKDTIQKNKGLLVGLRKLLVSMHNKLEQQKRQSQGEDFDLDAVINLFTDVHSGHSPSEKIYLSKRKKQKDISITLLMDISLSSDSYTDGNRVLDVEKESAILFGEILNEFNIDFEVAGFYSKTRNFCTYITLKAFDDSWEKGKHKIGAVRASGYTRIGPALRHAGAMLAKRPSVNKWLLILSDGKPNDYDKYEGKYGVGDVKQALRELKKLHIHTHALAIEKQAKYYLPQMFGVNNYQVMPTPNALLKALVLLFEKIRQVA